MQQLAKEADPHAPSQPTVPKMTSAENRLPIHDKVVFNMDVVNAHLEKWKSKNHLSIKPDSLNWTPFLVTRGPHQDITAAMNSKDPSTAPTNLLPPEQNAVEILKLDNEHVVVVDKDGLAIDLVDSASPTSATLDLPNSSNSGPKGEPSAVIEDSTDVIGELEVDPSVDASEHAPIVEQLTREVSSDPSSLSEAEDVIMQEPLVLPRSSPYRRKKADEVKRTNGHISPLPSPKVKPAQGSPRRTSTRVTQLPSQTTSPKSQEKSKPNQTIASPRRRPAAIFQPDQLSSSNSENSENEDELRLRPHRFPVNGTQRNGTRHLRSTSASDNLHRSPSLDQHTPAGKKLAKSRTRDSSSLSAATASEEEQMSKPAFSREETSSSEAVAECDDVSNSSPNFP